MSFNARCWMQPPAVLAVAMIFLTGCAGGSFDTGPSGCPTVGNYSRAEQVRVTRMAPSHAAPCSPQDQKEIHRALHTVFGNPFGLTAPQVINLLNGYRGATWECTMGNKCLNTAYATKEFDELVRLRKY